MKFDVDSISFLDISYSNPFGCLTTVSVGFPLEKIISKANKNYRAHLIYLETLGEVLYRNQHHIGIFLVEDPYMGFLIIPCLAPAMMAWLTLKMIVVATSCDDGTVSLMLEMTITSSVVRM
ncbi:unnamed protein product [Camellia sinensis]